MERHCVFIGSDMQEVHADVREDARNAATLFVEHLLGAALRSLANEHDAPIADSAIDRILGLGTHRDRHFTRGPASTQRTLEHSSDGARLAFDLRICGAFRQATQHYEEQEDATEYSSDDPEHEPEDVVNAGYQDAGDDPDEDRGEEREQEPPDSIRVVATGHLEHLVHLLETTGLFGWLRSRILGACHGSRIGPTRARLLPHKDR